MSLFSSLSKKLSKKIRALNKTRKAPPGLEFIGESGREAYHIINDSEVGKEVISNSVKNREDRSFNGKVLKVADNREDRKRNLMEFKTWEKLKKDKFYRKHLARIFACTKDGRFVVMEKVKPVKGYSPEKSDFADKMKEKVMKDIGVKAGRVDVHGDAIGVTEEGFKVFDYPWIDIE